MKRICYLILLAALCGGTALAQGGNITAAGATCATSGACVSLTLPTYGSTAAIQISGTYGGTLQFEGSTDGANYVSIIGYPVASGTGTTSTTSTGIWQFNVAGLLYVRVRCSAFTSGPATVKIQAGPGSLGVASSTVTANAGTGFPAPGTAGSPSANVITVQGSPSMTPLLNAPATVDAVEGEVATNPPVPTALQAESTEKSSVDDGDVIKPVSDLKGRQVVNLFAVPEMWVHGSITNLNATTDQDIIAADASYKICLTNVTVYNTDTTNSEFVQVLEGGAIGTGTLLVPVAAPANGGQAGGALIPPVCTSAVNKKITVDSTGSANPVVVFVSGYKTAE